jgi:copper chaperone CopZ
MKTIITLFIGIIFSLKIQAQSTVLTTTVLVKGNCGECKERIENAADIKGVKTSSWSEKTKVLTITFDSKKVSLEQIEQAIANAGHEVDKMPANDKAYNALPSCCQYKTKDCKK